VHAGIIERIFTFPDHEKTCALFKCFWANTLYFFDFTAGFEETVFAAVFDDIFCGFVGESGNIGQN
jgi:hypothetical protein